MTTDKQTPQTAENGEINKEVPKDGGLTNALLVADKIMDILDEHGKSPMAVKELVLMINDLLIQEEAQAYNKGREDQNTKIYNVVKNYNLPIGSLDDAEEVFYQFRNEIESALSQQEKEI